MSEQERKLIGYLGQVALFILLLVSSSLINGYTICTLWAWFAVPTFGLPSLTIAQALGLSLTVSYFSIQQTEKTEAGFTEKLIKAMTQIILKPAIFLSLGWIYLQFIPQ